MRFGEEMLISGCGKVGRETVMWLLEVHLLISFGQLLKGPEERMVEQNETEYMRVQEDRGRRMEFTVNKEARRGWRHL